MYVCSQLLGGDEYHHPCPRNPRHVAPPFFRVARCEAHTTSFTSMDGSMGWRTGGGRETQAWWPSALHSLPYASQPGCSFLSMGGENEPLKSIRMC